jgi:acyl-CoA dehydrogenase
MCSALEAMCRRVQTRTTFGSLNSAKGCILSDIASSRIEIEQCRLLTLQAAAFMDTVGNKAARQSIAMIKVAAPNMAQNVFDRAIQAHGGLGTVHCTAYTRTHAHHAVPCHPTDAPPAPPFSSPVDVPLTPVRWSCLCLVPTGVTSDMFLARLWTGVRSLRLADGPDEVHRETVAKFELKRSRL